MLGWTGSGRVGCAPAATIARVIDRAGLADAVDLLLTGPRGRRALAGLLSDPHDPGAGTSLWHAETLLTHLDAGRTTERAVAEHVSAAVAETDLAPLASATDPVALLPALQEAVDWAWYWQRPSEHDVLLARPLVAAALRPLAEAVLASPAAAWWWRPCDTDDQHHVEHVRDDGQVEHDPALQALDGGAVAAALARWRTETLADEDRARRERPTAADAPWSGRWWSTPALTGVLSSRSRTPTTLTLVEDSVGWPAAQTRRLRLRAGVRVYEVDGPDAWVRLASRYPLPVTRSRRHDWYRATGWDGSWVLPDWSAVAADWDGVHVSPLGYLTTAGRALVTEAPGEEVLTGGSPGPARTLLAGWDPGTAWWLRGAVDAVESQERWHLDGGHPG